MGKFDTHGGYFAPQDYFRINTGGSHDENPNGGVQVGVDEQGIPNMLEEGEPVYQDYVYSDNITADKSFLEEYKLPSKYDGKLYSDIADDLVSEAEERPLDPISNNGLNAMLVRLANAQEGQKNAEKQKELEDELSKLSPEELAELEQMLGEQVAAEEQTEEVAQEPLMMDEGGPLPPKWSRSLQETIAANAEPSRSIMDVIVPGFDAAKQSVASAYDNFVQNNPAIGIPLEIARGLVPTSATQAFSFGVKPVYTAEDVAQAEKALPGLKNELAKISEELKAARKTKYPTKSVSELNASRAATKKQIADAEAKIASKAKVAPVKEHNAPTPESPAPQKTQLKSSEIVEEAAKKDYSKLKKGLLWGGIGTGAVGLGTLGTMKYLQRYDDQPSQESGTNYDFQLWNYGQGGDEYADGGQINKFDGLSRGIMPNMMDRYLTPNGGLHLYDGSILDPAVVAGYVDDYNIEYPFAEDNGEWYIHQPYTPGNYDWDAWGREAQNVFGGHAKFNQNMASAPYFWPRVTTGTGSFEAPERHSMFTSSMLGMDNVFDRAFNDALANHTFGTMTSTDAQTDAKSADESASAATKYSTKSSEKASSKVTEKPDDSQPSAPAARRSLDTPPPTSFEAYQYALRNGLLNMPPKTLGTGVSVNPDAKPDVETEAETAGDAYTPQMLPTGLRTAGAWLAGAEALANIAQEPERYNFGLMQPYLPYARLDLQRQRYMPVDENELVNQVRDNTAGTIRGLRESGLGPSTGAAILAADNAGTRAMGQAFEQGRQYNNNLRNSVIAANNQASTQEANFDYGLDAARANILNRVAERNAMFDMQRQLYEAQDRQNRYNAISGNLDAVGQALSGIGQENFVMNQINSNRALYDALARNGMAYYKGIPSAFGGHIMLKRYKK